MTSTAERRQHPDTGDDLTAAFRAEAPALLGYFLRRVEIREDAADLVSDTFLAAWKNARRAEIAPELRRAWLYGIAHKVLSQYRRGRTRRSSLAERLRSAVAIEAAAGAATADHSHDAFIRSLVARLPEPDREIVALVYWEGFTQEEVARIVGKPAPTVRSRLTRARQTLRDQL